MEKGKNLDQLMIDYFNELFKFNQGNMNHVLKCITSKVSDSHNLTLIRPVDLQEVKNALFDIKGDKSPGPDGMSPGFFQQYWDIVGWDILQFYNDFVQKGKFERTVNQIHIVLIPKKNKPSDMSELRPISLCNILYKIASKVLANRLKPLLHNLISKSQSVFDPGRLITDTIMVAYET